MARGIEGEELFDGRGVGDLDGIFGEADELLEPAEKQDLHANRLGDRCHTRIVTRAP